MHREITCPTIPTHSSNDNCVAHIEASEVLEIAITFNSRLEVRPLPQRCNVVRYDALDVEFSDDHRDRARDVDHHDVNITAKYGPPEFETL